MVSPGAMERLPLSAVARSQGLEAEPLPPPDPLGATYQPTRGVGLPEVPDTLTALAPCTLLTVATMLADPAATPVATPSEVTLAAPGVPLDHDTGRPVSTFPAESRAVAVSCTDCPTVSEAEAGLTETVATG